MGYRPAALDGLTGGFISDRRGPARRVREMSRKTLSYREVTDIARAQIERIASIAWDTDDRDIGPSVQLARGVKAFWEELAFKLDRQYDSDAQENITADRERFENLFTETVKTLREEDAHTDPKTAPNKGREPSR